MSTIVKNPKTNQITVFTKGADSKILPFLYNKEDMLSFEKNRQILKKLAKRVNFNLKTLSQYLSLLILFLKIRD